MTTTHLSPLRSAAVALMLLLTVGSAVGAGGNARVRAATVNLRNAEQSFSGVIMGKDGFVVTSDEVLAAVLPLEIHLWLQDVASRKLSKAVITRYEISGINAAHGIALLKLALPSGKAVVPARINTRVPTPGSSVSILGFPELAGTILESTVTSGVIRGKPRVLADATFLDFSCPANPGNAGGPLYDGDQIVCGVVVFREQHRKHVALAVPASVCAAKSQYEAAPPFVPDSRAGDRLLKEAKQIYARAPKTTTREWARAAATVLPLYRQALKHLPEAGNVWAAAADCYRSIGDVTAKDVNHARAEAFARRAIDVDPAGGDTAYDILCHIYHHRGDDEKAMQAIAEGLKNGPLVALACARRSAAVHRTSGNLPEAIYYAHWAIDIAKRLGTPEATEDLAGFCTGAMATLPAAQRQALQERVAALPTRTQKGTPRTTVPVTASAHTQPALGSVPSPPLPTATAKLDSVIAGSAPTVQAEVKPIALGAASMGVFASDYSSICVTARGTQEIRFYDALSLAETGRSPVPRSPSGIARAGDNIVIACRESKLLAVIDPAAKKLVDIIPLEREPVWSGSLAPSGSIGLVLRGESRGACGYYDVRRKHFTEVFPHPRASLTWTGKPGLSFVESSQGKVSLLRHAGPGAAEQGISGAFGPLMPKGDGERLFTSDLAKTDSALQSCDLSRKLFDFPGVVIDYLPREDLIVTAEFESTTDRRRANSVKLLAFLYISAADGRVRRVALLPQPVELPSHVSSYDFRRFLFNPANETVLMLNGKSSKSFRLGPVKEHATTATPTETLTVTLPDQAQIGSTLHFATCRQGQVPGATYHFRRKAPGMTLDANSSQITWQVPTTAYGIYSVEVILKDTAGSERTVATWQVGVTF